MCPALMFSGIIFNKAVDLLYLFYCIIKRKDYRDG